MKRLVIGILAHVDSGKTTLSESLLYLAGQIRKMGRVDHGDAFLDTDKIEKERGITIFSKQAHMCFEDCEITLLDTPGHVDFSAEMERTLCVLDYAILVISGTDGVQSHTQTLWRLLEHYGIPTFIFVNKMDLIAADKNKILSELSARLGDSCLDFENKDDEFFEMAALLDSRLLDEYTKNATISAESLKKAILSRKIFPCFFGSALKNEGIEEFLNEFINYTSAKKCGNEFGAKVFKISEDERGQRLTHIKVTSGSIKVKGAIDVSDETQKINEIRLYSGEKYTSCQEALPGGVYAVTGLLNTYPGQGIGIEKNAGILLSEPVFTYGVILPDGIDITTALIMFKKLQEEDPKLNIMHNKSSNKIEVQIMGAVQLEVLKSVILNRFNLDVEFEKGSIIYKETIENAVEGVGHYEPLRHYAEVHLLIEPAERGSGITIKSDCSEDVLSRNWQRLILTHLEEKAHLGVFTGSPLTDVRITLINGRAHIKHTDGGDFRQATYRAVRQGLMQAKSILLEPWYSFTLEVPLDCTGRALTDLQQLGAEFDVPETHGEFSLIAGKAPISKIGEYHKSVIAYTHGEGRFSFVFSGYEPCTEQDKIVEEIGYNSESDTENTADSVFCSHGSGYVVKWDEVYEHMHIPAANKKKEEEIVPKAYEYKKLIASEEELLKIFEQTYGKVNARPDRALRKPKEVTYKAKPVKLGPVYLLVDGYNIIFAWDELKKIAEESLDLARTLLIDKMCNYQAMKDINVIVVFDAYKVKDAKREIEQIHGVSIVYTKTAETADEYIEKTSKELSKNYRVRVATSDNLEQIIVFGNGAHRISASEFYDDVKETEKEMRRLIEEK